MTDDERAIRALVDRWMSASKSGDAATVLSLITDDAVFLVPGREPFGKEAFAQASGDMRDVSIDGESQIVELHVLGDWAWMRSRIKVTMTAGDAPPMRRSGYTLTILRKGPDGKWRLARDANLLTQEKEAAG